MPRLPKQQPRASDSEQAMYTLKQACQVVGIDSKTLQKWLKDLEITPVEDRYDHRVRLLSEEQVRQLVAVARRRRHVAHTPKGDAPPGGYIRTVKDFSRRIDEFQETIGAQAEVIKELGEVGETLETRGRQTLSRMEEQHNALIAQLDAKAEASAQRFAQLAAELEALVASLARESDREGRKVTGNS